jgi:hypothetical protein
VFSHYEEAKLRHWHGISIHSLVVEKIQSVEREAGAVGVPKMGDDLNRKECYHLAPAPSLLSSIQKFMSATFVSLIFRLENIPGIKSRSRLSHFMNLQMLLLI